MWVANNARLRERKNINNACILYNIIHALIVKSISPKQIPPAEYSVSLLSDNARLYILSLCASATVWMHVLVVVSHILIDLSVDADINLLVLKERQRDDT
jgi:hypothetical protein